MVANLHVGHHGHPSYVLKGAASDDSHSLSFSAFPSIDKAPIADRERPAWEM